MGDRSIVIYPCELFGFYNYEVEIMKVNGNWTQSTIVHDSECHVMESLYLFAVMAIAISYNW